MTWNIEKKKSGEKGYRKLFGEYTINLRVGKVCLKNGEEIGLHSTEDGEEVVVILSGKGLAKVENKEISCSEGDVLYFGPYTKHNIKTDQHLCYIYIWSNLSSSRKREVK